MRFLRFLCSRTFLINLLLAVVVSFLLLYTTTRVLNAATQHGEVIRVPELSGLTAPEAQRTAQDLGLATTVDDSSSFDPQYPPLSVTQQIPHAGARVKQGRVIHLTINPATYKKVKFRDIFDKSLREAKIYFQISNLKVGQLTYVPYIAKGVVIKAEYDGKELKAGDEVPKFSTIALTVGKGLGNQIVHTPNLLGMTYEQAADQMKAQNFLVGQLRYDPEADQDNGTVYRQSPKANSFIKEGSKINLWLTIDSTKFTVPGDSTPGDTVPGDTIAGDTAQDANIPTDTTPQPGATPGG